LSAEFLPLLNDPGIVGKICRAMQEVFCSDEIVALGITIAESGQRIPIVRIFPTDLLEDGDGLCATPIVLEQERVADSSVSQVSRDGRVVWGKFMRGSEDRQIVFPLLLLRECQRSVCDNESSHSGGSD
jgi:hypothetical protein